MNYTLDRFPPRERADVMEIVRETVQLSTLAGSLGRILENISDNKKRRSEAQRVLAAYINNAQVIEADTEVEPDLLGKMLGKVLKFIGKRIIKAIVRPILEFAGRMAMNIIRVAVRTVLRFVIIPVFEAVVAFALANPLTAAALAIAAVAGGGYYLYKKYISPDVARDPNAPVAADTSNVSEAAIDVEDEGPQAYSETQRTQHREVYNKSVLEEVATPVKNALRSFSFSDILAPAQTRKAATKGKKSKFTGFGADVDGYIHEGSVMFGLPEDEFRGFIKMEGGWTGAMSPTGAIGTGQFIQPTWDGLATTDDGIKIGMTKIGKRFRTADDPRYDKRVNTLATALLARENKKLLDKNDLPVTGENLYMLHNIGPGIIQVMLGHAATEATLKAMRQNGMTKNMTAEQFLEFQKGRFRQAYREANSSTVVTTPQPQMARAVTVNPVPRAAPIATTATAIGMLPQGRNQSTDLIRGPGSTIVRMQ